MKAIVKTFRGSKTFIAPLEFVFRWCTDFREDDGKMTGSKRQRHILERSRERVVWRLGPKEEGGPDGIRVVWLNAPDKWHLETCGDGTEVGDYKLIPLGKKKTRLDMVFRLTYYRPQDVEEREEREARLSKNWELYARFLEKEYQESSR